MAIRLDVTRQEEIDAAIATTVARFGRLDILANNAGSFDLAGIAGIARASYARVFAVNVEGLLFVLQAAARQMVAQGDGGRVINFASQAGRLPLAGCGATKRWHGAVLILISFRSCATCYDQLRRGWSTRFRQRSGLPVVVRRTEMNRLDGRQGLALARSAGAYHGLMIAQTAIALQAFCDRWGRAAARLTDVNGTKLGCKGKVPFRGSRRMPVS